MKKILLAVIIAIAFFGGKAYGQLGVFNHLGVGANVGSEGIGFHVATPITDFVQLRAGASFMPGITFTASADGTFTAPGISTSQYFEMDMKGDLKRTQFDVIFNVYPFGRLNSLFVAVGGYFGGEDIVKINGHSDEIAGMIESGKGYVKIGDYNIPVDENGNASGGISVKNFRPYFGIGYGRPVPGSRLGFMVELGVQVHGKMKAYTDYGTLEILDDVDNDWKDVMDKLTVYPVLKFTLSGKIF
ncbi:MAG: hypothetical protein ACI30S_03390 [Muribaculaceae bacterium]